MTIDEIRKGAPPKATHYYEINGMLHYALIRKGRVYRIPHSFWIECYEGWLKYFKHELKPL